MKTFLCKFIALLFILFLFSSSYSTTSNIYYSVKFLNSACGIITGDNGTVLKTTDGGMTWQPLITGTLAKLVSSVQVSETDFIVLGDAGTIIKSVDGGNSCSRINTGITENLRSIDKIDQNTFFACGNNGTLIMTLDAGETWHSINLGVNTDLKHITFIDRNTGFIIGKSSTLFKTTDGGNTWVLLNSIPGIFDFNCICMTSAWHGTIAGDNGIIFSTSDGGISWYGNSGPQISVNLNKVTYYNETCGLAVGDNRSIVKTTDGGVSWQCTYQFTYTGASDLKSVFFNDSFMGITVGSGSKKLYTNDGGISWYESYAAPVNKNLSKQEISATGNFPNPFNPSTIISYELSFDANVNVKVFDMTGKVVAELVNGFQKAGSYNASFNGSSLASGIYFYRITAVAGSVSIDKTMKMMLVK